MRAGIAVLVAGLGWPCTARADEPPPNQPVERERVRLVYSAPADCPSTDSFFAEVRARVATDWEAAPGELARTITVSVTQSDERYVARVELENPDGERVARAVSGKVCVEVVNGIALVTALAIQSRVEEALERSDPAPPTLADVAPPPPPKQTKPAPAPKPPPPSVHPEATETSEPPAVEFGARVSAASDVGPGIAWGPGLFAAIRWSELKFGVGFDVLDSGWTEAEGVPVRFTLLSGRLEGCPLFIELSAAAALELCGFMDLGSISGRGSLDPPAVVQAHSGGAPWAAPGLLGRLVLVFDPLTIGVEIMGRVPLRREKFGVETDGIEHTIFQVPALGGGAALELGVRL